MHGIHRIIFRQKNIRTYLVHADGADTRRVFMSHTECTEYTELYLDRRTEGQIYFSRKGAEGAKLYVLLFFCLKLNGTHSNVETSYHGVSPLCGRHSGRFILENTNFTNFTNRSSRKSISMRAKICSSHTNFHEYYHADRKPDGIRVICMRLAKTYPAWLFVSFVKFVF